MNPQNWKNLRKRVNFQLDTTDDKQEEEMVQISKDTQEAISKLDKVIEDEENSKHRIDAAYINFPSSQEKFDLYNPETEDITDEGDTEITVHNINGRQTFAKKNDETEKTEDKDVIESENKQEVLNNDKEEPDLDAEEKKDETESEKKDKVIEHVKPEHKLEEEEEKKDETESEKKERL